MKTSRLTTKWKAKIKALGDEINRMKDQELLENELKESNKYTSYSKNLE